MKILAAHNTLTSYRPKGLLSVIFNPFSKCQSSDISDLYDKGVRLFDFRIRMRGDIPIVSHGLCSYRVDLWDALNNIVLRRKGKDNIYIRIVNEDGFFKSDRGDFLTYVRKLMNDFGCSFIKWQIIPSKKDLNDKCIDDFPKKVQNIECFWYKGRKPLFPKNYSKSHQKEDWIKYNHAQDGIWWFDFI